MATTSARSWRSRVSLLAIAVVAAVGLLVVANRVYHASPRSWPREPFSAQAWAELPRGERFRLMKDLDAQGVLAGRSEQQVLALLGEPDYRSPDARYLQYVLKEWSPAAPMNNALFLLQVDLNPAGKVTKHFVRHE